MSDLDLVGRRGAFDGQKFFSRSPFRSGYFLVVTSLCMAGAVYGVSILYRYRHQMPSQGTTSLLVFVCGFVYPWWRAVRYHERLHQVYVEGSLVELEPGSAMDVALGVAAGAINDSLFFCFTTMLALLAYI